MSSPFAFTLELGTIVLLLVAVGKWMVKGIERDIPLMKARIENLEDRITEHTVTTQSQVLAVTKMSEAIAVMTEAVRAIKERLDRIDHSVDNLRRRN